MSASRQIIGIPFNQTSARIQSATRSPIMMQVKLELARTIGHHRGIVYPKPLDSVHAAVLIHDVGSMPTHLWRSRSSAGVNGTE
jgi:hypothetical protein